MKTPENFLDRPLSSVLMKSEAETIARNIMAILSRTGNKFRPLTWSEYEIERQKDGDFSQGEKKYFDQVIPYCKSEDTALLFSKSWGNIKSFDSKKFLTPTLQKKYNDLWGGDKK